MTERTQQNPLSQFEQELGQSSGIEVWRSLVHYKWLIVFCTLVGTGLGYLYFLRQPAVYQTSARILMIKEEVMEQLPVHGITRSRPFEENITTQMLLLRSPLIVEGAIEKHKLDQLPSFVGRGNPGGPILGGIDIKEAAEKANVLDVYYKGSDPEDCRKVVEAMIDSYQDFLHETHQDVSKETVKLIENAQKSLLDDLKKKEDDYRDFRRDAPLVFGKDGGVNIHRQRLNQIESSRSSLIISRTQTKAQLTALENALARGGNREALMLMMDKLGAGESQAVGSRSRLAADLFPMLLEEQMLLEDYGPEHPKVKAIRRRIQITRDHFQSLAAQQDAEDATATANSKNAKKPDFMAVYLESLREDLKAIDSKEQELNELFALEEEQARESTTVEIDDENRRHDIERTTQLFEGVVKRLEEINLLQDFGKLKMRVLNHAPPGWQVAPVMSKIMGMAIAMGFFSGCGLTFLIELADKRFRSPEEITEALGLPVIGHIPFIRGEKADATSVVDSSLCVYHAPKSGLAEAYRGVRTALYFSNRGEGHKVIQVSSPNPGDGKSTLASNLSVAMAQSGKKTLLIESDFRRPRVHKLLGIDPDVGVTSVIAGECELADAIQETPVLNLYAMTCGPRPSNPSELLSSPRYAEMLSVLREKFDYVVIDTPPLLAVTDPAVVAPRVDGVLLAVRINKRSRHDCVRANDLLASLGVNVLGIIVNGTSGKDRYGYGRYRGGYRYGGVTPGGIYGTGPYHGYGYGYGYGYDNRYSSYYVDEEGNASKRSSGSASPRRPRGTPQPPNRTA